MSTFTVAGAGNGAELLKNLYSKELVDTVYGNGLASMPWIKKELASGDSAYRWLVRTAANGSLEEFSEGQALPAADVSTYANAAVAWIYIRAYLSWSGMAQDQVSPTASRLGSNIVSQEIQMAGLDLSDLMSTTCLGSTAGLELSIDSSSNYAGITRATSSWWQSLETDVSGALAFTDLLDTIEGLADNDRGQFPNGGIILAPYNQLSNLAQLAATNATTYIGPADKAPSYYNQTFAGHPVVGVGDLTDTTILFVSTARNNIRLPIIRPLRIDDQGRVGDADTVQLSIGFAPTVNRNPLMCGKLVNVTA